LSNKEALDLFNNHRPPFLSHLLLSHLSKENNSPEMVEALFSTHANGVNISIASRYQSTAVFSINIDTNIQIPAKVQQPVQMALFDE